VADVFLDSAAVGGADGTTWSDAYTTLSAAITGMSASDTLAWARTSSESLTAGSKTFIFPAGCTIISSTVSGATTITSSPAMTAQLSGIGTNDDLTIDLVGSYVFGVYFAGGRALTVKDGTTEENTHVCGLITGSTSPAIRYGATDDGLESLNDTRRNESTNTSKINSVIEIASDESVIIKGGTISTVVTATGDLDHGVIAVANQSVVFMDGVDCTGVAQVNFADLATDQTFIATNCALNALTVNLVRNVKTDTAQTIIIEGVDSANTVNRQYRSVRQGELFSDTGIILDATNPDSATVSNKIVTNTNAKEFFIPARFPIIQGWADFSTAKTFDIEFVQDGTTTDLTDAEIWVEVQYPDDTTALYNVDTDRAADNQTTANQTSSSASWTGLSGTNVKQKCSVTTTQTGKQGPYQVFLCLAKPSTTVYVNPKADIS